MKKETFKRLENDRRETFDYLAEEDNFYHMEIEERNRSKKKNKRSKPSHKKWDE
jgi:hypothetical protein